MTSGPHVSVIGAGSWGTAIARLLASSGNPTLLWAREPEVVESIESERENTLFLPGVRLEGPLRATGELDRALDEAEVVVSAVPTQFVRGVLEHRQDRWTRVTTIVSVSKGIEIDTLCTPTQVLAELVPPHLTGSIVALSGPSFAQQVSVDHPTAVVAAGSSIEDARAVRDLLSTPTFRVYSAADVVGVELGGALKNVVAIAAGMSVGLGFAENSLSALMTRGLAEMMRLGVASGGDAITFAGLSGMGDLVLTCSGDLSRNRTVGREVGRGRRLDDVLGDTSMVAEGVKTTLAAHRLAGRLGVEMPIVEQVHATLYEGRPVRDAVDDLMGRALRDERDR